MALKIGFAFKCEPNLSHTIQQLKSIESILSSRLAAQEYGASVKAIYIGIVLMEPDHARRFATNRPVYKAGRYELREPGLSLAFEDTLEFDVVPRFDEVRRATAIRELALPLRHALSASSSLLQETKIPNFDMARFLADLDRVLSDIANAWPLSGDGANGVLDLSASSSKSANRFKSTEAFVTSSSVEKFAHEVVDFVEREMPNVQVAVRARRGDLLKQILARANKLIERWHNENPAILEACPACTCLIADVIREGAIEISEIGSEERERLHKEFHRNLEKCKAVAGSGRA
jgi:hypothetical protein